MTDKRKERGKETKSQIIQAAKEVFYEVGYTNATMQIITKKIDSASSLITYHFKTKENLAREILSEFYNGVYAFLEENQIRFSSLLLQDICAECISLKQAFCDENTARFCMELDMIDTAYRFSDDRNILHLESLLNELGMSSPRNLLHLVNQSAAAARRDLYLRNNYSTIAPRLNEMIAYLSAIKYRLLKIDHELIDGCLAESFAMMENVDYQKVKLLI